MLEENVSLLSRNTFGIDVRARYFFEYASKAELVEFLQSDLAKRCRLLHIGGGSNLLFLNDFDGVVLHSRIGGIEVLSESESEVVLRVGAAVVWDDFVHHCVTNGWGGVENLSLIPGEVGASPVQNIGAYGVEAKDVICGVEAVAIATGELRLFSVEECEFGYRSSVFKHALKDQYIVTYVHFSLSKQPIFRLEYDALRGEVESLGEVSLRHVREAVIAIRRRKLPDPSEIGSAGSFFMNPVVDATAAQALREQYPQIPVHQVDGGFKLAAGWLIEQCGWKGVRRGTVGVYEKQALVLINSGGASGAEVAQLAADIQHSVYEKFGVKIKSEVIFV